MPAAQDGTGTGTDGVARRLTDPDPVGCDRPRSGWLRPGAEAASTRTAAAAWPTEIAIECDEADAMLVRFLRATTP